LLTLGILLYARLMVRTDELIVSKKPGWILVMLL